MKGPLSITDCRFTPRLRHWNRGKVKELEEEVNTWLEGNWRNGERIRAMTAREDRAAYVKTSVPVKPSFFPVSVVVSGTN